MSKISAIILNYNTPEMTQQALEALHRSEGVAFAEVIVVDNGSDRKFDSRMAQNLGVRLIRNEKNLGFAKAVNQGMEISNGKYVLLLNSDSFVEKDCLSRMLSYLERNPRVGMAGPLFVYPNGRRQISAGRIPDFWGELMVFSRLYKLFPGGYYVQNFRDIRNVDWLSGGCLLIRKEAIDKIGMLDENYFFGVEDMDFCLRAKKDGWGVVYYPLAKVVHNHGQSSGGRRSARRVEMEIESFDYFFRKNFPEKKITRWTFEKTRRVRLLIFKLLGWK